MQKNNLFKILILLTGIALFAWSIQITIETQKLRAHNQIQDRLNTLVSNVKGELDASIEVLHSISNLFHTFGNVTASQFDSFTDRLSSRKKGILLIEWQPKVLGKDRDAFIKQARKNGLKGFELLEPGKDGKLVKAPFRDEYCPVLYAVSTKGVKDTSIGLNLSWSPDRMKSKYEARDSAKPLASNSFPVLLTSKENKDVNLGFAITLPVYNTYEIPKTLVERRQNLKGYLAVVIYLKEFLTPLVNKINEEGLKKWEKLDSVKARSEKLYAGHQGWRNSRKLDPNVGYPGIRYAMLHTFSHLLIRELALECGYNASSIRERIYSSNEDGKEMAGVLLYTAAADSDGTLGGLVELGKPEHLGRIISQALSRSEVCASDPLCSEHDPSEDRSLHLASCHACTLVAETSCERGNRYLDRALLVKTFDDSSAAYFPQRGSDD